MRGPPSAPEPCESGRLAVSIRRASRYKFRQSCIGRRFLRTPSRYRNSIRRAFRIGERPLRPGFQIPSDCQHDHGARHFAGRSNCQCSKNTLRGCNKSSYGSGFFYGFRLGGMPWLFTPCISCPVHASSFHAHQGASSSPYGPISITNCLLTAYPFAIHPLPCFHPLHPPSLRRPFPCAPSAHDLAAVLVASE